MPAQLAAMATGPDVAGPPTILRDKALMANVEQRPPLTDEQRETLGAFLVRSVKLPARRPSRQAA
jgi:hypothetical protein